MKAITSLTIEKTMFDKLVEIGFLEKSQSGEAGFIANCTDNFVVNFIDKEIDYGACSWSNFQIANLEKEMFEKLIEIGAVPSSVVHPYITEGVSKYWISGFLFGKFGVSTLT